MSDRCPHCGHKPLPDVEKVHRELVRRVLAGEKLEMPETVTLTTVPGRMSFSVLETKKG